MLNVAETQQELLKQTSREDASPLQTTMRFWSSVQNFGEQKVVLVTTSIFAGYVLRLLIIILGQQYISCVTCVCGGACPGTHCHG